LRYLNEDTAALSEATREAEAVGREITDPRLKAFTLADMATCLYATDQELPKAKRMMREAARICEENGFYEPVVDSGSAMQAMRDGRYGDASAFLKRSAPHLNRKDFQVIEHYHYLLWSLVELEADNPVEAMAHTRKLRDLGEWVKQKADFHFPDAVDAMAKRLLGEPDAESLFLAVLEKLRGFNCKVMTAYLLLFWCEQDLAAGRHGEIEPRCREAIERCEPLGRTWEPSWARALMGLSALRQGSTTEARGHWEALRPARNSPGSLPARILRLAEELSLGLESPR